MDSIAYSTATLSVIASIGVAIAGFSGVVVALTGRTADSFGVSERLNLRILLQVSAFAILFSIVPLILNRAMDSDTAWRLAMLIYGLIHVADAGFFTMKTRRLRAPSLPQRFAPLIGLSIAISQVLIALLAPVIAVEVAYLIVLVWHLGIAGMGFAHLVFSSRNLRESSS